MKYHMSQLFGFSRYHSRADALTQAIDLALFSFKLFQICAILFEVSSGCPGTGWQSLSLYLDLLSLIDSFFSKMKPSVSISFLDVQNRVGIDLDDMGHWSRSCFIWSCKVMLGSFHQLKGHHHVFFTFSSSPLQYFFMLTLIIKRQEYWLSFAIGLKGHING